jgi:hypothetical protein
MAGTAKSGSSLSKLPFYLQPFADIPTRHFELGCHPLPAAGLSMTVMADVWDQGLISKPYDLPAFLGPLLT